MSAAYSLTLAVMRLGDIADARAMDDLTRSTDSDRRVGREADHAKIRNALVLCQAREASCG